MANLAGFDANEVPEDSGFSPVPKGRYPAIAIESEMKPTRAGTGEYLQAVFEILDGTHKGRRLWRRMNVKNPNPTAQDIGQRELAEWCKACGNPRPNDSEELHNIPVMLDVDTELDDRRREVNVIKKILPVDDSAAQSTGAASAPREPAAPRTPASTGEASKPWARRAA